LKIASLALVFACVVSTASAETGMASYYGGKHHGRKMANGQVFNQWSDSCAHKTRKFGTVLTVTMGSRSVRCVVRDRGPFIRGRIIDLSVAGARDLGLTGRGVAMVSVQ
jgi:rare lipoprotein A